MYKSDNLAIGHIIKRDNLKRAKLEFKKAKIYLQATLHMYCGTQVSSQTAAAWSAQV